MLETKYWQIRNTINTQTISTPNKITIKEVLNILRRMLWDPSTNTFRTKIRFDITDDPGKCLEIYYNRFPEYDDKERFIFSILSESNPKMRLKFASGYIIDARLGPDLWIWGSSGIDVSGVINIDQDWATSNLFDSFKCISAVESNRKIFRNIPQIIKT